MTVVPLLQGQTLQGFAGSAVDVTELLNTQLKLREQLAFNDALIENSPVPLVVRDLHNRYLRVNPAWEAFTGRQRDAVVGTVAALQHAPEHSALHEQHDRALLARGDGEVRYEAPVRRADGALRNVMVSKALIRDGHGRATAIVGTFVDISELREAEQAIRAARDAAISASQAKTEFIANVSHELRTPLQAILGFSELGLMRVSAQPKLTAMFSDIHQAGQRMLGLVNELLDLSKVDRSSLQLDREPCGPLALLSAAAAELAPLAQAKELPLQLASTAGATVPVDPGRMAQVLRNLLANAIRFAPAGTAIELAAADGPSPDGRDGVTLTVADRGPGIPPGELESIFEPFVQSSLTKDGSGGTGLGLAIARRIVQAHGGTLHAANRAGGGAVFVLWLPASRIGAATTVTA
jgi:PAS domain S-box-containing protein